VAFICCACEAAGFKWRKCNKNSVVICIDLLTALSANGRRDEIFKVQHFGQSPGRKYPYFGAMRISMRVGYVEGSLHAKNQLNPFSRFSRTLTCDRQTHTHTQTDTRWKIQRQRSVGSKVRVETNKQMEGHHQMQYLQDCVNMHNNHRTARRSLNNRHRSCNSTNLKLRSKRLYPFNQYWANALCCSIRLALLLHPINKLCQHTHQKQH